MKLKALKSFAGKISMYEGEVREVLDEAIAKDLLRAGHVEKAKDVENSVEKSTSTPKKPVEKKKK